MDHGPVMMVLATRMNLVSAQADITAAFVHAHLGPDEHIYVRQPAGFQCDSDLVLKLKKSFYGLRQSPRNFFNYLSDHLSAQLYVHPSLIRVSLWASPW